MHPFLSSKLSEWVKREGIRAIGQVGFKRGFSTLDLILTLRAIIEEGRSRLTCEMDLLLLCGFL